MGKMLRLYGSAENAKLVAKGGVCNRRLLKRQIGGREILGIERRRAK